MKNLLKSTLIVSVLVLLTACGGGSSKSGDDAGSENNTGGSGSEENTGAGTGTNNHATNGKFDVVATSNGCGGAIAELILNGTDASGTGTTSAADPFDIDGTRDINTGVISGGYVFSSVTNGQFATYTGIVNGNSVSGTFHNTLDNCDGTWSANKR